MARGTILVVDDDPDDLRMTGNLLRGANFGVVTATSPAEALAQLEEHPVDVAVIDIRLKNPNDPRDYSGWRLAKTVQLKVPVIFFTKYEFDWRLPQDAKTFGGVDKLSTSRDEELLALVQRTIRPVVYVAHTNAPRAAEIERHIIKLGLLCSLEKPRSAGTEMEIPRSFTTDAERAAFAVVLLTADPVGPGHLSASEIRAMATLAYEWGYFSSKRPEHILVLYEDGTHLPDHVDPHNCVRFDHAGAWTKVLEERLRTRKLLPTAGMT